MGDRTGLRRIDRTNGYDDGRNYMIVKKAKLAQQNDEIREALRHRHAISRTEIFKGISVNVNGRTQPTADELKRLVLLNGGDYHPYYVYKKTKFLIATNLSQARIKQLRPDDRVIKPDWIVDSLQVGCLLPYEDYQIFFNEPRGKKGDVLNVELTSQATKTNLQVVPLAESYTKSYRKASKPNHLRKDFKPTSTRDIREFFKISTQRNKPSSSSQPKQ